MKRWLEQVRDLGYEKPRAAVAQLALVFFGLLYLLVGLNAPPGWGPAFLALSTVYLVAFFALACEAFWARWFASGLAWSGTMVAIAAIVMIGWQPQLGIYGGLHALILTALLGPKMAARFDMQPAWRERFGMDEFGVVRLRKAVTRAAAALPSLILWALGPKEPQSLLLGVAAAGLTTAALYGLIRLRTWSVLALVGAALFALALPGFGCGAVRFDAFPSSSSALAMHGEFLLRIGSVLGAMFTALAVLPFLGPAVRFLRRPR